MTIKKIFVAACDHDTKGMKRTTQAADKLTRNRSSEKTFSWWATKKTAKGSTTRTPFVWCILLSFHFGGETWWAQCATRKSIKLHMLWSSCCCVARHERPFWIPGTRFLSGFSFRLYWHLQSISFGPENPHYMMPGGASSENEGEARVKPNAASKVHKSDLRFYRKIKLMEMAGEFGSSHEWNASQPHSNANQRHIKSKKGNELSCKCYSSFPQKNNKARFLPAESRLSGLEAITLEPWQWLRRT